DGFLLLAVLFTLPILLAFGLSWILPLSIWGARHLIIVFPVIIILASIYVMAVPITAIRNSLVGLCILILVVAFAIRADRSTASYVWCAWEGLENQLDAGDGKLYATEDLIAYHLWYSKGERAQVVKLNDVPGVAEDKAYFIPRGFDEISTKSLNELDEPLVRIAYRSIDPDKLILLMNAKGYALVETKSSKTTTGTANVTSFKREK
ncbi:MAG TPA: hypothetical protein VJL58_08270, partial [Pyrinomonadaceae bacterium]|nr:hypothetical protein [Pyrinomonadaceae bacterium]